jgi:hypothetical protein
VGVPGNRSMTSWQRYVIPSRMWKPGGSLYGRFTLILKMLSIGSPTDLFQTFQGYGIGNTFITGIKRMYEGATSLVQINDHQYGPITIRCVVRQGCPISIAVCALCLHPFHRILDLQPPGIRIGRRTAPQQWWLMSMS